MKFFFLSLTFNYLLVTNDTSVFFIDIIYDKYMDKINEDLKVYDQMFNYT